MIKARSKSKIKSSVAFLKKDAQEKSKKPSKDITHRKEDKQNSSGTMTKLSLTSAHSKKKLKPSGDENSRPVSPLCLNKKKNEQKNEDQKFIQKLFSQTQQPKQKDKKGRHYLVEKLIQQLVPEQNILTNSKSHHGSQNQSTDIFKQLHLKNQEVATLQQEIQELKLYISNFTFKVFDLTVLCRKYGHQIGGEEESIDFNRKTDEVISYLDSLIRHWKLEDKIKIHCQNISKKMSSSMKVKADESRKRCHTESLKIPIEDYLQSLQNTGNHNLNEQLMNCKLHMEEDPSEEIMKILSRRSSAVKKQQQQVYVAIKGYEAKNQNQLDLVPGERVSVLQKNFNDRWLGVKQGKIGYFPKQCLF